MKRLYHGCVSHRQGRDLHNSHIVGVYDSDSEALGGMIRVATEKHPGIVIVNAVCYPVPDELVRRTVEEQGCIVIY